MLSLLEKAKKQFSDAESIFALTVGTLMVGGGAGLIASSVSTEQAATAQKQSSKIEATDHHKIEVGEAGMLGIILAGGGLAVGAAAFCPRLDESRAQFSQASVQEIPADEMYTTKIAA